jgi:hypothetical protein
MTRQNCNNVHYNLAIVHKTIMIRNMIDIQLDSH